MTIKGKGQKTKPKEEHPVEVPRWLIFLLLTIPAVIYIPGILGKIPFPSDSTPYNDLLLTHYPNALFLKSTLIQNQQIPLWSTFIHSGAPFAANPLAGLFYLPGWLALIFPLPEGISIVLALHALFSAWGMYLFLKNEYIGDIGAIAGGLIIGLMPKMAAHYGAGHISLLYAISWTPWLFLISKKDQEGWKTGICAALLFLADPRWSVYAGIIWLSYDVAHRHKLGLKTLILYYTKTGMTALLIASPLIIPLYEYIGLSTRAGMGLEDIQAFSLSPEKILGLLIPTGGSNPEWYIYFGGTVFGLYLLQLMIKPLRKINRFWNIWVLISLLMAFGSWFLNPGWLIYLPVISLLRVPARSLFLIGFSFAIVAARSIEFIKSKARNSRQISKAAFGMAAAAVGLGVPIIIFLGKISIQPVWGFAFLFLLAVILLVKRSGQNERIWDWVIIGILIVDLLGAGLQSYHLRDMTIYDKEIISSFEKDTEKFRIYSPSYSIPQWVAVENNLEITDGVDPMHITEYSDFMEKASGVNTEGYSVTIPDFVSGNPDVDNSAAVPDAFLLSLLNVKYIISGFDIENQELVEIDIKENAIIFKNSYSSERAWVEESPKTAGVFQKLNSNLVSNLVITPNRIEMTAQGPGRLVLSEIQYPGWKATIDGEYQNVETAYGILRCVNLLEGKHSIVFYFRPITVYLGIGMAMIGWTIAIWQVSRNRDG